MAYDINDLKVTPFRRASQPLLNSGNLPQDVKKAHSDLQTYLESEFRKVQDSIQSLVDASPQVAFKAPERPRLGMIRYAKSPWDPLGTGDGWTWWDGSAWQAL